MEIASSLDFLWKQQARKELEEMSEMRRHTNQLLQNLLPLHVAKFFLHCDRQGGRRNTTTFLLYAEKIPDILRDFL